VKPHYCVDTSALIDWLERFYPPANFPTLLTRVDDLITEGRFFLSEEVWNECQQVDVATKQWCAPRKGSIAVGTDAAVAAEAAIITTQYHGLVNPATNKGGADPFVIAVARLHAATVVTGERGGTASKPKIPFVCGDLHIPCISFLEVIVRESWTF
jgi:hypothetical protein